MLKVTLVIFEAVYGVHINWGKNFIYLINEVKQLVYLTERLGGRIGDLPAIYLRMPLGAKSKSKGIWDGVVEKCKKKLTNWKNQHLSRGGRLTLIKVYWMHFPPT